MDPDLDPNKKWGVWIRIRIHMDIYGLLDPHGNFCGSETLIQIRLTAKTIQKSSQCITPIGSRLQLCKAIAGRLSKRKCQHWSQKAFLPIILPSWRKDLARRVHLTILLNNFGGSRTICCGSGSHFLYWCGSEFYLGGKNVFWLLGILFFSITSYKIWIRIQGKNSWSGKLMQILRIRNTELLEYFDLHYYVYIWNNRRNLWLIWPWLPSG